jgi:limonene-1,2-epoxide hydrolase
MTMSLSTSTPTSSSTSVSDVQKIEIFREMARAWRAQEWRACADLFTAEGVLHSVMLDPVVGRETIFNRISKLGGANKLVTLHIHRIGVVDGALFVERSDEIVINGQSGVSPVVGVLEFEGDKIALWREYYDRAQLARAAAYTAEQAHS